MVDKVISTALKRFKLADNAEQDIRKDSLEDLKFSAGDQWPDNVRNDRQMQQRPCLTVDQTGPFIRQITNDQRQNRPSLKISATDDSTEDTAEVLEGIVRHIQAQSDADIAYDTATDSQVRGGFGYFRVLTDYCQGDPTDPNMFDAQEIRIKRIKNPFTVYCDPASIEPVYEDMKWAFVVEDLLKEDFKEIYPDAKSDFSLSGTGDQTPGWMTDDFIRVAEYWTVEEKSVKAYLISDGQSRAIIEDLRMMPMGWGVFKERDLTKRKVMWRKITGHEVLDEKEWAGKYIPIIPVLGEDLDIDGKRVLRGLVRTMKDPQRMYNYWTTAATEAIALAPKSPWVIAAGQLKGYEKLWEVANQATFSHLPYNVVPGAPPPTRNTAEPPIAAMSAAINQATQDLSRVTGIFKEGLGEETNADSGKAIIARQREGDIATYHYQDNLARSIKHLGRILLDLIPKIYDTPRVMRILHEDGTSKTVKINQPSDDKDENGIAKIYDLTTGIYDVAVNVGPSYTTKRQESADSTNQIIQSYPEIMGVAGDLLVKQLDFPGADQLADRLRMTLPPQIQQQIDGQQPLPPQAQAKLKQAGDMIQALSETIHKLMDERDQKTIETQSKEKIAAMGENTKLQIAGMNNKAGITEAVINQSGAVSQQFVQHNLDMIQSRADAGSQAALMEQDHSQTLEQQAQAQVAQNQTQQGRQ